MSCPISRRNFLRGLAAGTVLISRAQNSLAGFDYSFNCDDEFSGQWLEWLRVAVGRAMRMSQPHVISNYKALHDVSHFLGDGVWDRSNLANGRISYWACPANLLEFQVQHLGQANIQPEFNIRWAYEPAEAWWGRAHVGTVAFVYDEESDGIRLTGSFEIQLNAYWATTNHPANTPDSWGGVIAHELLHNLGHRHGVNEYDDRWPINIFDRCVSYNGRYRGGYRQYNWLCGGAIRS